jgi:hypothetical protein
MIVRGVIVKVSEVMPAIKSLGSSDAEAEALKRQADYLRKRKQALKVSKARERLVQAQQAQSELLNKGA